jgi:N-acetylneuraminic acid mutarotase
VLSAAALTLVGAPSAAHAAPPPAGPTRALPDVVPACGTPRPGQLRCFALRRTDVPTVRGLTTATDTPAGYGATDLQDAYRLPAGGGAGQTIAIVDAYDDPNAEADLAIYRQQYGLPACTTDNGCFQKVDQRGGGDYPQADSQWSGEISLDLDMVSAAAPGAHVLLVEADTPDPDNLGASVDEAVSLGAGFVSNSYGTQYTSAAGSGESPDEAAAFDAYYNHPGVAIVASAGDYSYGVAYPAASPYVTSVGGTALSRDPGTARGWSESVWNDARGGTGSGCSLYEPKPGFQVDTGCANRSVADVAAVAAPSTGVSVYQTYGAAGWSVYGGTSASAPIIAGVYAAAGTPTPGSYPNSYPYRTGGAGLNDVTTGSNGACTPDYLCTAGTGYDGPTGMGTPDGLVAFRDGPHGTILGTVTDASSHAPVPGATVAVGATTVHTAADGSYSATVPAGTYDVAVNDYGYATGTATAVQVADGSSVTESFALTPLKTRTVSGKVTDGSGHGWPLYARITIDGVPGGPIWTDPYTGAYQVKLPVDQVYALHVTSAYPGYQAVSASVSVGTSDVKRNVSVPADPWSGGTPGYTATDSGTTESFDSASAAPGGWTVTNAAGTSNGWEFDDPAARGNNTGGSGAFAVVDSDHAGPGATQDSSLISPAYDLSADTFPELTLRTDYHAYDIQKATVDASTDGGATWSTVWSASGTIDGPSSLTVPLTGYAHDPNVRLRFHFTSSYGWWWEVDDVFVGARTLQITPGGLIAGTVTDANTGAPLDATDVSGKGLDTATTATPDDPALTDGFYWMFAPAGNQSLVAAKRPYAPLSQKLKVRADTVTRTRFALKAGKVTVGPTTLSASVGWGKQITKTVTIKNTGGAPATVTLAERPGSFTTGAASAPPQRTAGHFSPLASAHSPAGSAAPPATAPAGSQTAGGAWQSAPDLPIATEGNIVDAYGGKVYSGLGATGFSNTNKMYAYDPTTGSWTQLASAQNGREAPIHGFIDGKLYVAGGWGAFGAPDANLEIYDPATDAWSWGPVDPAPLAAAGSAVLGGKLYSVGGCGLTTCGSTAVTVYDPSTGTWSTAADYPQPTAWPSCGTIRSRLYCAGGTTDAGDLRSAYVYDPSTDSWSPLPSLPDTVWGSASAAANGQLLLAGGIVAGELSNQAFAYDPASAAWSSLPNVNQATYRGGAAPGLYTVGGDADTSGLPVATVALLPGYDQPDSTDVTWLSESTQRVTVQPGRTVRVSVTLNAAVPRVDLAGTYTTELVFNSDTPYPVHGIPVSLTVAAKR